MKKCSNCKTDIADRVQPWHKCQSCNKEFCGICGDRLIDSSMRCRDCRSGRMEIRSVM